MLNKAAGIEIHSRFKHDTLSSAVPFLSFFLKIYADIAVGRYSSIVHKSGVFNRSHPVKFVMSGPVVTDSFGHDLAHPHEKDRNSLPYDPDRGRTVIGNDC
ncbi:hypothetical protein [Komagataeibacter oboediens]|uniref:hypothetical protein n=1 Tax=Komagataeibacter oboediens TaxID=65958 RepID=UPI001C2D2E6B|nr:hypothetical protein [Komagataeibacter oboediens]MBV1824726.1 hypothetical protein [Komagataeibacter oboediens]